jgi:hypothetical protein
MSSYYCFLFRFNNQIQKSETLYKIFSTFDFNVKVFSNNIKINSKNKNNLTIKLKQGYSDFLKKNNSIFKEFDFIIEKQKKRDRKSVV